MRPEFSPRPPIGNYEIAMQQCFTIICQYNVFIKGPYLINKLTCLLCRVIFSEEIKIKSCKRFWSYNTQSEKKYLMIVANRIFFQCKKEILIVCFINSNFRFYQVESGNIEYKLKLVNPSESRFEHLVTQMKWRLQEGEGEAIYEIGVSDNGVLTGLKEEDLRSSLDTLEKMAKRY